MLDCALVSSDEAFRHAVLGIVRQPAAQARLALDLQTTAGSLSRGGIEKILEVGPRVAFLDLGPDAAGVGGIQVLTQEAPDLLLIVAGPPLSAEALLEMMRAGVTEYLPHPISQEETLEAFLRVRKRVRSTAAPSQRELGQVTTVFSAKGGTGVTTMATNLAIALRMLTEKEVLLLDLTPTLGTVSVAMGVQPRYSYLDVIRNFHRIDEELFRSFLEPHDSGVYVLASPVAPVELEPATGEDLKGLVALCRQYFDFVVIDGGSFVSSHLLATLQESDDRILVVTPELPSLRNLKQAMDVFGGTNGKGPPKVVLNQYSEGTGLSSGDVEDGLGHRLAAIIQRDENRVPQSVNLGRPEVLVGKSRFAKDLMDLGSEIAGPERLAPAKESFIKRLFGSSKRDEPSRKEAK